MNDIISISSSEDEDVSKHLSYNQKRKLSISIDDESGRKRHKVSDATKFSSNTSESNKSLVNPKESANEFNNSSVHESTPGSSKLCQPKTKECGVLSNTTRESNPVKVIRPQLVVHQKIPIPEPSENTFLKFIEACGQKKSSDETKKILNNLRKRYDKLNSIDKDDEEFQSFLKLNLKKILNDHNDKFYAHIQEVNDEIKRRTLTPKISTISEKKSSPDAKVQNIKTVEDDREIQLSKEDMKKVRRLEKAIKICQKRIKILEEKEVDFDEDEDSAYLQEDRYKRKLVELCKALSEIVGDRMLKKEIYKKKIRRKDILDEMTGIPSVDEAIISFINSNIDQLNKFKHIKKPNAVADYLAVPDYLDILNCIKKCNEQKDLELSTKKMQQLAKTAFKSIVSYLQKQRIHDSQEYISSCTKIGSEVDPATKDPDLNKRLQNNKKDGDKKLEEIFQKYVARQEGLSPEDLEKLEQVSTSEDDSDYENFKSSEKNNSKNYNKTRTIQSDGENNDQSDVTEKTNELMKNNIEEKVLGNMNKSEVSRSNSISDEEKSKNHDSELHSKSEEIKNKDHDFQNDSKSEENKSKDHDSGDSSKSEVSKNKNHDSKCSSKSELSSSKDYEIKKDKLDCKNKINTFNEEENACKDHNFRDSSKSKVIENKNHYSGNSSKFSNTNNSTDKIVTDNAGACINQNKKSFDRNTSIIDAKEINSNSKENEKNIIDDDDIQILSDDSEKNFDKSKPISKSFIENKEKIKILNNTDKSSMENTTSNFEIKNISCNIANISKDNVSIPEKCKIKSKETISTPQNSLNENKIPIEILETFETNGDVEIYPVDSKNNNETNGPVNTEDENCTSFIKVCSFAKPPESWKNLLSPDKTRNNLQLPIQQALKDLSKPEYVKLDKKKCMKSLPSIATQLINPVAINRKSTTVKSVPLAKVTDNHNNHSATLK